MFTTTSPVSPKVKAAALAGFLASLILPNISLVTVDMLPFLGPWAPFAYAVAVSGITAAAGWITRDPLRTPAADPASQDSPPEHRA